MVMCKEGVCVLHGALPHGPYERTQLHTQSRYAVDSPDGEGEGFVHAYAIGADGTLTPVGEKQAIGGAVP